jgi:hypothetical protein
MNIFLAFGALLCTSSFKPINHFCAIEEDNRDKNYGRAGIAQTQSLPKEGKERLYSPMEGQGLPRLLGIS